VVKMMFYKETNFKDTPIGKNPKDWKIVKLGSIAYFESGKRPKGGALGKGEVLSIGGEHIDESGNLNLSGPKFIPRNFYNSLKQGKLRIGDVIMCKDGAKTGKVAYVEKLTHPYAAVNEHVFIIRSMDSNTSDNRFIFYVLFSNIGQNQIKAIYHGMIGGITSKDLANLKLPLPPLSEQQKITEILSTVDSAIQKTNEVIAKTERLKKGLMQELLTKGIGHKEFKDTEIGRIPKDWKVVKLEEVTKRIVDAYHKIPPKTRRGIPFISVNYILNFSDYNFYIDENVAGLEYISETDYLEFMKRFSPEKGDILYSKWGTPGVAKLINTTRNFIGSCSLALIKPNNERIYSLYLVYALNAVSTKKQIIPFSKTSTRTEIHIGHIKKIKIPLPLIQEQQKIAEILLTVDKKLELERREKAKLEKIKQGLMDLLLTGEIRIKVG